MSLLGRTDELALLHSVLDDARWAGRIFVVEGEGGVGKTRLVDEAVAHLPGFVVLRGSCQELELARPLGPLAEALTSNLDLSAETGVYAAIDVAVGALETVAASSPVVLVLDDLHWADPATLRVINAVGRMLPHLRLALVATMRPAPRNPELERLLERMPHEHLKLQALTPADTLALAAEIIGAPPAPRLAKALGGTAGNPLFIVELLRALQDEHAIRITDERADVSSTRLPRTLRRTILRRLSFLPDETLEVLRLASVLGSSFHPQHLSLITARPVVELLSALHEAVVAGFLAERGDRLAFGHDLVREAIYDEIPEPLRLALHLEVGQSLDREGAPSDVVAQHMALGARAGDTETISWMRRAASELRYRAPHTALLLLERALELAWVDDAGRDEIAAAMILPLELVGRAADAWRLGEDIIARRPPPKVEYLVRRSIGYSRLASGDYKTALAHYGVVTTDRFASVYARRRGEHAIDLGNFACAMFVDGDLDAAARIAASAVAVADETNDELAKVLAQMPVTWLARASGVVSDAVHVARRMVDAAESSSGAEAGNVWPHLELAWASIDADAFDDAERALKAGLRIAAEQGRAGQVSMYHLVLARLHLLAGEWDVAEAENEAALAVAEEVGALFVRRMPSGDGHLPMSVGGVLAFTSLRRGDVENAAEALARVDPHPGVGFDLVLTMRGFVAEARGDLRQAAELLAQAWDGIRLWGYYWDWRSIGPDLVRLAIETHDNERATEVTLACEEGARLARDVPTAQGAALRCRGLLDNDAERLLRAIEAYRRGPRRFDLARACEDAASVLAVQGARKEAEPLLAEAIEIHRALGGLRDVSRVASAMRAAGIRRGVRGARSRPKTGWDSLTPAEIEVVQLVTTGLTNREIGERLYKSRHTVESHLRHVFAKLGVSSRVELTAAATKRNL